MGAKSRKMQPIQTPAVVRMVETFSSSRHDCLRTREALRRAMIDSEDEVYVQPEDLLPASALLAEAENGSKVWCCRPAKCLAPKCLAGPKEGIGQTSVSFPSVTLRL